ncbi:MAG TPA: hypothetical protein VN613_07670 [Gemmatimonadaceae bacterium]|nr:hypothetical protein [Gemmatimonadaceae bacterium]
MSWIALAVIVWLVWCWWQEYKSVRCLQGCYMEMSDTMIRIVKEARTEEVERHGKDVSFTLVDGENEWKRVLTRHRALFNERGIKLGEFDEQLAYEHYYRSTDATGLEH